MESFRNALIAIILWILVALAIDRFLLPHVCPLCTNAAGLELKLTLPSGQIHLPPVSLIVLIGLPMVLMLLWLIPWKRPLSGDHWRDGLTLWAQPWAWLILAVILTLACESLFLVSHRFLPNGAIAFAEKFSLAAKITVAVPGFQTTTPLSLTASFAGLIGFLVGAWFFLARGVKELFD